MRNVILFFFLLASAVYADPENYSNISKLANPPIKRRSLTSINYQYVEADNILSHITLRHYPAGSLKVEYVGLHDWILSDVSKRIRIQARDDLRRAFNLSNMSDSEFRYRMDVVNGDLPNPYGEWWDRHWYESLLPEKGGAPKEMTIVKEGLDISIPESISPYWWLKRRIEDLGDIWIDSKREFDEEGKIRNINRSIITIEEAHKGRGVDLNELTDTEPEIGILKKEETAWFRGSYYHLRFRPSIKFKPDDPNNFVSEISLRAKIELFARDRYIGNLSFSTRYDFPKKEVYFSVYLEFVSW